MKTYNIGLDFEIPFPIDGRHASVSHDHATITIDGDEWTLCDNDSTNGTYVEVDGAFRQCKRLKITPNTWIRLGEEGHRGYYFKARRVIHPKDYHEDFEELYEIFQECEERRSQLETRRRTAKFIGPGFIAGVGFLLSSRPGLFSPNPVINIRASFIIPTLLSPLIQDAFVSKLGKKVKSLQGKLICPKCRRALSIDDIINREHLYCKAR